jgi:electron transfer flavoprotein beta subunit
MGLEAGVLVTDKAFAGSDTWATSRVLTAACRRLGVFDLVICGERATDGDTGQVGPGIAGFLHLPVLTYVSKVDEVTAGTIRVHRLVEDGYELLQADLPCVLTVVKEIASPRLPTLRGKQRARRAEVPAWGAGGLDVPAAEVGLAGSPTRVVRIFRPQVARECEKLPAGDDAAVAAAAEGLVGFLGERNLL